MISIHLQKFVLLAILAFPTIASATEETLVTTSGVGSFKAFRHGKKRVESSNRVRSYIQYFDASGRSINVAEHNLNYGSAVMNWKMSARGDREKYPYPESKKFQIERNSSSSLKVLEAIQSEDVTHIQEDLPKRSVSPENWAKVSAERAKLDAVLRQYEKAGYEVLHEVQIKNLSEVKDLSDVTGSKTPSINALVDLKSKQIHVIETIILGAQSGVLEISTKDPGNFIAQLHVGLSPSLATTSLKVNDVQNVGAMKPKAEGGVAADSDVSLQSPKSAVTGKSSPAAFRNAKGKAAQ